MSAIPATAATLWLAPDSGTLSVDGGSQAASVAFNGVTIRAGALVGGVREYMVLGDLRVRSDDLVTLAGLGGTAGVRFVVGNNAWIDGRMDVSGRNDGIRNGGGGAGGGGGLGGAGTFLVSNGAGGGVASSYVGAGGTGSNAFFFTVDTINWVNSTALTPIGNGGTGLGGGAGSAGSAGLAGLGGNGGRPGEAGLNDSRLGAAAGGGGGAGRVGGGIGGAGGDGGARGSGGTGERLQFNPLISGQFPIGLTPSSVSTAGSNDATGAQGAAGGDGIAGLQGGAGQAAARLSVGAGSLVARSQALLFGGHGGGGGGGGGQGQQGGGGGGGGAGGGSAQMCENLIIMACGISASYFWPAVAVTGEDLVYIPGAQTGPAAGGNGGNAGHGGRGGSGSLGGFGGMGAKGGAGGGVIEVAARGVVTVNGELAARGGNATSASAGEVGLAGFDPAEGVGGLAGAGGGRNASAGGRGGDGGRSGMGGRGGDGGAGAGGGGGTVKIVGTELRLVGAARVDGGAGSLGGHGGADGHVYLGSNASAKPGWSGGQTIVDDRTGLEVGSSRINPYLARAGGGFAETPYLSDRLVELADGSHVGLEGGAEIVGRLEASGGQAKAVLEGFVEGVRDLAPGGSAAALGRLAMLFEGETGLLHSEYLVIVNLSDVALDAVSFGVGLGGMAPLAAPLALGGWERDVTFGGSGPTLDVVLTSGQVWLTTMPASAGAVPVDWRVGDWGRVQRTLDTGDWVFLTAVPEPGTWATLLTGLLGLGAVVSKRRAPICG